MPIFAICIVGRINIVRSYNLPSYSLSRNGYEILPANDIGTFLFVFLLILIVNSLWFKKSASYTFWSTLAVFGAEVIIRELFIILFYILAGELNNKLIILGRVCFVAVAFILLKSRAAEWLQDKLGSNSYGIKFLIANTFIVLNLLIFLFSFNTLQMTENLITISSVLFFIIMFNIIAGLYIQKKSSEQKRLILMEQYIPVIEELITQVSQKQHEYNNRLLSISAAVQTANSLEQAKQDIEKLIESVKLDKNENAILNCDSKIVSGLLFSKIKDAEIRNIKIETVISTKLKNADVREEDIIEIVGILIDNTIEASNPNSVVILTITKDNGYLSIIASNPHEPLQAVEFVRIFQSGYSTKQNNNILLQNNLRGYGLANVKKNSKRYHDKIITRNETIGGENYISIGVLLA